MWFNFESKENDLPMGYCILTHMKRNSIEHGCQTNLRIWHTLSPPRVIGRAHKGGDSTCSDQCHHTKWLHQGHNPLGPGYTVGSWNVVPCNNLYSARQLWFLKVCPFVFQRTQGWILCHPLSLGGTCFKGISTTRCRSVPTTENAKLKWMTINVELVQHSIVSVITQRFS